MMSVKTSLFKYCSRAPSNKDLKTPQSLLEAVSGLTTTECCAVQLLKTCLLSLSILSYLFLLCSLSPFLLYLYQNHIPLLSPPALDHISLVIFCFSFLFIDAIVRDVSFLSQYSGYPLLSILSLTLFSLSLSPCFFCLCHAAVC